MRYVFLLRFYSGRLAHPKDCLAITHRAGESPREVLDAAWAVVGRPRDYAELVFHGEDVLDFPSDFPDYLSFEHLTGMVSRIEVSTVGKIATAEGTRPARILPADHEQAGERFPEEGELIESSAFGETADDWKFYPVLALSGESGRPIVDPGDGSRRVLEDHLWRWPTSGRFQ